MALGLVGLGGSTIALVLAAVTCWVAALLALPSPPIAPGTELARWWSASPPAVRLAVAAVAGAGLAWSAWLVRHPALGLDTVQYHLTEAVIWVREGNPGAGLGGLLEERTSIPLVSEVLLAWELALARSQVPVALLAPQAMLLLVAAGWLGLRSLGTGRALRVAALGALCATPMLTHWQYNGAYNDLPALAFLVACAALVAAAPKRPGLLAPALLAGALAAGTKTTALPLTLVVLGIGFWSQRGGLAALRRPLALVAVPALVLGLFWYARDLVEHGSPFWPDLALPWGDEAHRSGPAFLERPVATLRQFGSDYLGVFAGGLLMIGGALISPLLARDRTVLLAAGVTLGSLLLWMSAPTTGAAADGSTVGTLSTVRYTLPTLAAAIVTLLLGARREGAARHLASGVLGVALVVNMVQTARLGYPQVPNLVVPLGGAALAALAAAAIMALPRPLSLPPALRWVAGALVAITAGGLLAAGAPGFVERHARAYAATPYAEAPMVAWLAGRPGYRQRSDPVGMAPVPHAPVVGDELQHPLELIPLDEPCGRVRARVRQGWVLLTYLQLSGGFTAAGCLEARRPDFRDSTSRAYAP